MKVTSQVLKGHPWWHIIFSNIHFTKMKYCPHKTVKMTVHACSFPNCEYTRIENEEWAKGNMEEVVENG